MTKEEVIKIRTALKCGKNIPIRAQLDGGLGTIDESNILQFTKWDDENGIIYTFKLVDMQSDDIPTNKQQNISIIATSYDSIRNIEVAKLPLTEIDNLFSGIEGTGCVFNDDFKNLIKHVYSEVLHPDRYQLTPTNINSIVGPNTVNDKDDYYYNKFTNNFKK